MNKIVNDRSGSASKATASDNKDITSDKKVVATSSNLQTRLLSAVILAPIALVLAYYNLITFLLLIAVFIVALSWEWGRMTRSKGTDLGVILTILTAFTMIGAVVSKESSLVIGILVLGLLSVYFLTLQKKLWAVAGVLYIAVPSCALVWFRADINQGFVALVFILLTVWTTDSASYAVGRMIGGVKFAPAISPNKTWAGFIGGIVAAAMLGGLFALALDSSPKPLSVVAFLIALASQYGDLLESSVKRHYNIKDSSQLIPGHGGAFDRLDGLLMAVLMAAIIAVLRDASTPAHSLLLW